MTPTDSLNTRHHPAPPDAAKRPYDAPGATPLGTIGAVTAGPDGTKTLDALVGNDGGFAQRDATS